VYNDGGKIRFCYGSQLIGAHPLCSCCLWVLLCFAYEFDVEEKDIMAKDNMNMFFTDNHSQSLQ
jgi:hypothetical protein